MRWGQNLFACLFIFFVSTISLDLIAADTGVSGKNLEYFHPSIDCFGTFGVNGPSLLNAGQPFFKISQSFVGGAPFQIAIDGQVVDIIGRIATTNVISSIGINHFLTVALDVPFHPYAKEANFNTLESFTTTAFGDLRMAMKMRLLTEKERSPGLALLLSNSFPTGDETKFLGTSHMVPGVELIAGKEFEYFSLGLNVGGRFPEQKSILGVNFDDQITYAGLMKVPFGFLDPQLSFSGEIRGQFEPNKIQIGTAPVEFTVGLRKDFSAGFSLMAGGGGAWNNAIGNPRYRGVFSVGYTPTKKYNSKNNVKKGVGKKRRAPVDTVYFGIGKTKPELQSKPVVVKRALFLKKHPRKKILLVGHTDSTGSHRFNLKLSMRRAEAIKKLVVSEGVDESRIRIEGVNADEPVAPNSTEAGRRLNRRVEIFTEQFPSKLH